MRVILSAALSLVVSAAPASPQDPVAAQVDWWREDSARIAYLKTHGRAYGAAGVVLWAPNDSLDAKWLVSFSDSLATAIASLKSLIGGPYRWQRIAARPVQFYLSPGRFVSHTDARDGVFISLARVRQRMAPYLHEAAHELLAPVPPFYPEEFADTLAATRADAEFPLWLIEGLPDYLAQATATATGFPEGDVFNIGGLAHVDSTCAARLAASKRRDEIVERVGGVGVVAALFTTERAEVAPVFYACSQSLTKYLVERVGLTALVRLFPRIADGAWRAVFQSTTGESLDRLRTAWLASLDIPSARF